MYVHILICYCLQSKWKCLVGYINKYIVFFSALYVKKKLLTENQYVRLVSSTMREKFLFRRKKKKKNGLLLYKYIINKYNNNI